MRAGPCGRVQGRGGRVRVRAGHCEAVRGCAGLCGAVRARARVRAGRCARVCVRAVRARACAFGAMHAHVCVRGCARECARVCVRGRAWPCVAVRGRAGPCGGRGAQGGSPFQIDFPSKFQQVYIINIKGQIWLPFWLRRINPLFQGKFLPGTCWLQSRILWKPPCRWSNFKPPRPLNPAGVDYVGRMRPWM